MEEDSQKLYEDLHIFIQKRQCNSCNLALRCSEKTMSEKCLMAASLAVLVFHPSSTIKCFKPTSTTSPERQRPSSTPSTSPSPKSFKKVFSKTRKKQETIPSNVSEDSEPETCSLPPSPFRPDKLFQSVSELDERDPALGTVKTLFKSGWEHKAVHMIMKVLRIQHTEEVIKRFEEYRELVKSRAAEICVSKRKERCVADGNEVLRYHGATIKCSLGYDGSTSICGHQACEVCSIIGFGFSGSSDWVSFCESSWRAHKNVQERDRGGATRAMLICRVIAGRVAYDHGEGLVEGEQGGFDSMVRPISLHSNRSEELIVLDPRGVLPCFVIIYTS